MTPVMCGFKSAKTNVGVKERKSLREQRRRKGRTGLATPDSYPSGLFAGDGKSVPLAFSDGYVSGDVLGRRRPRLADSMNNDSANTNQTKSDRAVITDTVVTVSSLSDPSSREGLLESRTPSRIKKGEKGGGAWR